MRRVLHHTKAVVPPKAETPIEEPAVVEEQPVSIAVDECTTTTELVSVIDNEYIFSSLITAESITTSAITWESLVANTVTSGKINIGPLTYWVNRLTGVRTMTRPPFYLRLLYRCEVA